MRCVVLCCDRLAKDQPAETTIVQISEVKESPTFNGRRSFLTLRARDGRKRKPRGHEFRDSGVLVV